MTVPHRPAPQRGVFDEPYWHHVAAGELRLQRCSGCGAFRYPPGPVCPECLAEEHDWAALSGTGSLLAWTVFHRRYFPEIPVPYVVAAIRTPEGPILIGNVVGTRDSRLSHGMPMRAVYEDVDTTDGPLRICQWTCLDDPSHFEE
ncbi:OB-fold domain-containing protein [Streptosporangium sp. NPDC051022]|uniref:Zn-ribbon domain-containing OB-fold protein n=1 Tax=Streptosporangium sp. NPDC051022 TaxID=3155752 RepID=UPI0034325B97